MLAAEMRRNLSSGGKGAPSKPGEYPKMQSGRLVRGVRVRVKRASPYTVVIENTTPHAAYLEFGTSGGKIIRPKNAKALRFVPGGRSVGAKPIFVKFVTSGSIKARRQAKRTAEECREKIRKIYTRGIPELKGGANKAIVRVS